MERKSCIDEIIKKYITESKKMDEAVSIVRRRLTKKEFKVLLYGCKDDMVINDIIKRLNLNEERYIKLYNSALKKIKVLAESNELNI